MKLLSVCRPWQWYMCTFIKSNSTLSLWQDLGVQIGCPTSTGTAHRSLPMNLETVSALFFFSCLLVSSFKAASWLSSPSQISHLMTSSADQVNNWWQGGLERAIDPSGAVALNGAEKEPAGEIPHCNAVCFVGQMGFSFQDPRNLPE